MADSAFTARSSTKEHVLEGINRLSLNTDNGQYTFNEANAVVLGCHRVLTGTFNSEDPGKGMSSLFRSSTDPTNPSKLSALKSTDAVNMNTVIEASIAEAKAKQAASANPEEKVEPDIQTRADAINAANRQN